jgi:hypothetical protein
LIPESVCHAHGFATALRGHAFHVERQAMSVQAVEMPPDDALDRIPVSVGRAAD